MTPFRVYLGLCLRNKALSQKMLFGKSFIFKLLLKVHFSHFFRVKKKKKNQKVLLKFFIKWASFVWHNFFGSKNTF
jgi:hypothetical protein